MSENNILNTAEQTEQDLYLQAAAWLEKLAAGELDSLSKRRFSHWLDADPRHQAILLAMVKTWQSPELTKALTAYKPHRLKRWQLSLSRWCFAGPVRPLTVLACTAALGVMLYLGQSSFLGTEAPYELKTARSSTMHQTLGDGSVVDMAAASKLTVFFTDDKRQVVQGVGAAYFAVAKDKNRPFEVRLDQATVVAVGTEFNIDRDPDNIDVTVYEGAVQVQATATSPRQLLKAGERVRIRQHKMSAVEKVDLQQLVDWRSGWIEIENESLAYLLHRLNRSAPVPLSASAEVADLRVAGRFELANTDQTLQALTEAYGLTLQQHSSGIRLSRISPSSQ